MMQSREEMRDESSSGLVLTTDPKPRLRWTAELHERFVDAVTHLGGPDSTFSSSSYISLYDSIYIKLSVILIVIYISRGYTKDDNESDGCEGSYALSSQEPSPGPILFFLSFLIFNVLLSFLSSFALGFKTYTRVSTFNYRSSDLESSLTRSIIKITPLILGILIEVR